jgi:CRP/FNR family transcriptional regulator, cyclic AMP receptor protein
MPALSWKKPMTPTASQRDDRRASERHTINLIEALPALAARMSDDAREHARPLAVVEAFDLKAGSWSPSAAAADMAPGDLGLLVVEGFMTRDVRLGATVACELVGRGDVLRPSDHDGDDAPVPFAVEWRVLSPARIAVLDRRAALVLGRWPELIEPLVRGGVRRAQSLAFHLAIGHLRRVEPRLQILFWHLADRWGRVTPEGVHVPLALTHQTLGRLVGAQRPSVTTALQGLMSSGEVVRRPDGTWMLHGEPPSLLQALREED